MFRPSACYGSLVNICYSARIPCAWGSPNDPLKQAKSSFTISSILYTVSQRNILTKEQIREELEASMNPPAVAGVPSSASDDASMRTKQIQKHASSIKGLVHNHNFRMESGTSAIVDWRRRRLNLKIPNSISSVPYTDEEECCSFNTFKTASSIL